MAIIQPPAYTPPPPAPQRNAPTDNFNDMADAWAAALAQLGVFMDAAGTAAFANALATASAAGTVVDLYQAITILRNQAEEFALTAVNAPGTSATYAGSLTLSTGEKAFPTQTGKSLRAGQTVSLAVTADGTRRMVGPIKSYDPATGAIAINVDSVFGSGSASGWTIALSAPGSIPVATAADIFAGTDNTKAATAAALVDARKFRALASASTLVWDILVHGPKTKATLTAGSQTLALPSGLREGDVITFLGFQPAAGATGTMVWPGAFKFGSAGIPVLPTANGSWFVVRGEVLSTSPMVIDARFNSLGVP